ncbi:hypothetical protein ACQ4PT_068424 [Festuca glaucescens]
MKRIFRYLIDTPNFGLWYPKDTYFSLCGFTDSDWVGNKMDRKSTSGACHFLDRSLVCWSSKKQNCVSISTVEAKYVAAASCCAQVLLMRQTLRDFGLEYSKVPHLCDNESAIKIEYNLVLHGKTKHIEIRNHFIRDHIARGSSSRRGGSGHRGVAKKPQSREQVRRENLVEREDGTSVAESILRQQEQEAAREAAKEREERARKRNKAKNETMYTIYISDYKELRKKFVYDQRKTSRYDCFWSKEQELIMSQIYDTFSTKVCPMRAFDLEKMEQKAYFNEKLWVAEKLRLHPLMELRQDYNIQLVHQFFATVYFGDSNDGYIYWITGNKPYKSTFRRFAAILGYPFKGLTLADVGERMHTKGVEPDKNKLAPLYMAHGAPGLAKDLLPLYDILLRALHCNISPSGGNNNAIRGGLVNFLYHSYEVFHNDEHCQRSQEIDVMDYIYEELHYAVMERKIPPYAPYIMKLLVAEAQTTDGELRACGAASLYARRDVSFPKIPKVDSVKQWQITFFYVKNENPAKDLLNLPEFSLAPPAKTNWGYCPKPADLATEVNMLLEFLQTCVTRDRLTGVDLLCTFISRRVLPLKRRAHKICYMSGRLVPTRTPKIQLSLEGVACRVNHISQAKLPDNWQWGMEPFSRNDPPALNFPRMAEEDGDLAAKECEADLPGPEDERDHAAGEDENPDADAQAGGGQGESASTHPSADMPDDDEVMILEPLRVTPLASVPPATGSAPPLRVRKRTTEQLEAKAKRQRQQPKVVPEAAGSAIKFSKCTGASSASGTISPPPAPPRTRREATPQPPARERAHTPLIFPLTSVGAGTSSSAPPPAGSGSVSQDVSARRTSQPTLGDLLRRSRPEAPPTGGDGGAPGDGAGSGQTVMPPPEPMDTSDPAGQAMPPPTSEPTHPTSVDAMALLKAKGPAVERQEPLQPLVSLHVGPAAKQLADVVSAPDSSLGSVGTMEKEWLDADSNEVTSRDGRKGMAALEFFFSDFRNLLTAAANESSTRLNRCEKAASSVTDKRAGLYNRLVASYHKAKTERADLARELEAARATAVEVPQLREELRLSREQCTASQETAKALAAKVKETEGELARLRRLEANHLTELNAVRQVEQEKLVNLNQCLGEVDAKCQKLSAEMATQSQVLSETAKRWVDEISALDRGLAAAFPETQEAALAAAGRERDARRAAGEPGSPSFSMDDHLAAMHAWIAPITMLGYELRQAVEELFRLLWPTETLPSELANLVKWLEGAPDRLLGWKESATRAGTDMALSFVLSWYEEVSLDQLETRRAGVEDELSAENKTHRLARACAIADFVNQSVFVDDPNVPEDDLEGDDEEDEEEVAMPGADPASGSGAPPAGPTPAGA